MQTPPSKDSTPDDIDPYASWLIKHKVRRLVRSNGLPLSDAEDVQQELALHAHLAAPKYDPSRGAITTFYDRVLARKIASIVQARHAQKRDVRLEQSLGVQVERQAKAIPLDVVLDVREAVGRLQSDLRPAALLFAENNEAQVMRATGKSRQAVRTLRHRLRQDLCAAGLSDYAPDAEQPKSRRSPYVSGGGRRRAARHARHRAGRKAKACVGKSPLGDAPCA